MQRLTVYLEFGQVLAIEGTKIVWEREDDNDLFIVVVSGKDASGNRTIEEKHVILGSSYSRIHYEPDAS